MVLKATYGTSDFSVGVGVLQLEFAGHDFGIL